MRFSKGWLRVWIVIGVMWVSVASVFGYKYYLDISVDSELEECEFLDYYALKKAGFKEDEMSTIGQKYLKANGSPTKNCIELNKQKKEKRFNQKIIIALLVIVPIFLMPLIMLVFLGVYVWIKKGFKD